MMMRHSNVLMTMAILGGCLLLCGCLPAARFTADTTSGDAPLTVTFTDNSATMSLLQINMSALCPIRTWDWDFGDGGGSTDENPVHVYTQPGTYTVSLTVSNWFWRATTTKQRFIAVGLVRPTAAFSADQTSGTVPFTVSFTDQSTPGSFPITSWQWDFGDGGGSAEPDPVHVYETDGVYSVSLTVSGPGGSHTLVKHN
ncbi:MAG TPA: PKD domain-containing protein, partial [Candidatus Hydrogenedentes bacterium]|nr:PKD domain-containing protein [Candidatus Hydrogenedentota bacterium]